MTIPQKYTELMKKFWLCVRQKGKYWFPWLSKTMNFSHLSIAICQICWATFRWFAPFQSDAQSVFAVPDDCLRATTVRMRRAPSPRLTRSVWTPQHTNWNWNRDNPAFKQDQFTEWTCAKSSSDCFSFFSQSWRRKPLSHTATVILHQIPHQKNSVVINRTGQCQNTRFSCWQGQCLYKRGADDNQTSAHKQWNAEKQHILPIDKSHATLGREQQLDSSGGL